MQSLRFFRPFIWRTFLIGGCLMALSGFRADPSADQLLGTWQSTTGDLRVEVMRQNGTYVGHLVWFRCLPGGKAMNAHFDTENPDPTLRHRPWLGLPLLENLHYRGQNEWGGGQVYDPNSGHTYEAAVRLTADGELRVRGYWKVQWLGKTLIFKRYS